jgi:hypothetical protein
MTMPHTTELDRARRESYIWSKHCCEAEAPVCRIQGNLKAAKLRQESYANKRRRLLQFEVGDHVDLKVSPMKGVKRFGVKEKLDISRSGTTRDGLDIS